MNEWFAQSAYMAGSLKTVAHATLSPYGLYLYLYMYGCGCTYWVTLRVFSWRTLQQQYTVWQSLCLATVTELVMMGSAVVPLAATSSTHCYCLDCFEYMSLFAILLHFFSLKKLGVGWTRKMAFPPAVMMKHFPVCFSVFRARKSCVWRVLESHRAERAIKRIWEVQRGPGL